MGESFSSAFWIWSDVGVSTSIPPPIEEQPLPGQQLAQTSSTSHFHEGTSLVTTYLISFLRVRTSAQLGFQSNHSRQHQGFWSLHSLQWPWPWSQSQSQFSSQLFSACRQPRQLLPGK